MRPFSLAYTEIDAYLHQQQFGIWQICIALLLNVLYIVNTTADVYIAYQKASKPKVYEGAKWIQTDINYMMFANSTQQ